MEMAGGKHVANRQGRGVASRHEPDERVLILGQCRLDPSTWGLGQAGLLAVAVNRVWGESSREDAGGVRSLARLAHRRSA